MTIYNKEYSFQQSSAPACSGTIGAGITILDACLIDGFNTQSINTISITTNIATVTTSSTHGFVLDEIIIISGANESIFNGEFKILSTPTISSFTFALTTELTEATGTMSVKINSLGWEKVFSGTNKAVYRSLDITGTRLYLRIDDTNAQYMLVTMYETMSDIDNGTGVSETLYWQKSDISSSSIRAWYLIGNSKLFYIMIGFANDYQDRVCPGSFGDFISCKVADAYNCMLIGHTNFSSYQGSNSSFTHNKSVSAVSGQLITKSYSQTGSYIHFYKLSASSTINFGYGGEIFYPNAADDGIHLTPVYMFETSTYRGIMPGLLVPFENTNGSYSSRNKTLKIDNKTFISYKLAVSDDTNIVGNCWFSLDDNWF